MIEVFYNEDTEFDGAEPIDIGIDTGLDLEGCTATIEFYGIVKSYPEDQVKTGHLPLSYTAEDTKNFALGRGYANLFVQDAEGRQRMFRRILVLVKVRDFRRKLKDPVEAGKILQTFINVKDALDALALLTEDDGINVVKDDINALLEALRRRTEFEPVPEWQMQDVSESDMSALAKCMATLREMAANIGNLGENADLDDVKEVLNEILMTVREVDGGIVRAADIEKLGDPQATVKSILSWCQKAGDILKKLVEPIES